MINKQQIGAHWSRCKDDAGDTVEENCNLNVLVAVSSGTQATKLHSNKILWFSEAASKYKLSCIMGDCTDCPHWQQSAHQSSKYFPRKDLQARVCVDKDATMQTWTSAGQLAHWWSRLQVVQEVEDAILNQHTNGVCNNWCWNPLCFVAYLFSPWYFRNCATYETGD